VPRRDDGVRGSRALVRPEGAKCIIRSHLGQNISAEERAKDLKEGVKERWERWYACFVIGVTVIPLLLKGVLYTFIYWASTEGGDIGRLLLYIFIPTDGIYFRLNLWHVVRLVNAGIVIWLYLYADTALRRLESGTWSDDEVSHTFQRCQIAQVFLVVYLISCSLIAFLKFNIWEKFPPIEFCVFP
jgi:hypothetical protein